MKAGARPPSAALTGQPTQEEEMTFEEFKNLYHIVVSYEFGGVTIHDVQGLEKAKKLAREFNDNRLGGETIFLSNVLTGEDIDWKEMNENLL